MNDILEPKLSLAFLPWTLGISWFVVLALHVWLHTGIARSALAGGSDSGMVVAKIGAITSCVFLVGCLVTLLLIVSSPPGALRSIMLALYCAVTTASLLSTRVVAIGGVRGDLAVVTGWSMVPVHTFSLSAVGIDDDVRRQEWSVNEVGTDRVTLQAGSERHVIWTGPFIQGAAVQMLSSVLAPEPSPIPR